MRQGQKKEKGWKASRMSTPVETPSAAAAAAAKDGKGKDRIGKVFYRVRTAFKRSDPSRRKRPGGGEPMVPAAGAATLR